MADIGKEKYFSMMGHHSLRKGDFDRDTGVVLAIDEEGWHLETAKRCDTRRPLSHAALGCDDGFGTSLQTLILQVLDILRKHPLMAAVEKRRNETNNERSTVFEHRSANFLTAASMFLGVGKGMGELPLQFTQPS